MRQANTNPLEHIQDNIYRKRIPSGTDIYLKVICFICKPPMFQTKDNRARSLRPVCGKVCKGKLMRITHGKDRRLKDSGHVLVYRPEHPYARKGFVPEHRVILEEVLGRFLTADERVHHINCDPADNRKENLFLSDKNKHSKIHANLEKCVKLLVNQGLLTFNKDTLLYEVTER
jgi:hypothetical protein